MGSWQGKLCPQLPCVAFTCEFRNGESGQGICAPLFDEWHNLYHIGPGSQISGVEPSLFHDWPHLALQASESCASIFHSCPPQGQPALGS